MASETKTNVERPGEPEVPLTEGVKEFTELIASTTAAAQSLAETDLNAALEMLLNAEKKTRTGGDPAGTAQLAVVMLKLCWEASNLAQLNAYIHIICKRRSQHRTVVGAVVRTCMEFVDAVADKDARVELITSLRTVSAGKIFVEVERARLTRKLAAIREEEGKIAEASETLQEVAVESYGGMGKREKADFLLEQLRLTLATKDAVRTQIISRKVNQKILEEEGLEDIRERFYTLMIELHTIQRDALALARDWEAMYATRGLAESAKGPEVLQHLAVAAVLAPHDMDQHHLLTRVSNIKALEDVDAFKQLVSHFTTNELAPWPMPAQAEIMNFLKAVPGDWSEDLHHRLVEHNIRVIAMYYKRITFGKLCKLIGQDAAQTEAVVSRMVSSKMLYAKIDRPAGIVAFQPAKTANATLSAWGDDISELLGLVETTCHLINKEHMIHRIKKK